jgi:hypothetical protein
MAIPSERAAIHELSDFPLPYGVTQGLCWPAAIVRRADFSGRIPNDAGTTQQHVAALRFFYTKTVKRRYLREGAWPFCPRTCWVAFWQPLAIEWRVRL